MPSLTTTPFQSNRHSALMLATCPPVFGEPGGVERSVDENATRGTTVGSPISATDREGAALNYSLSRDEWNAFSIDESTGQVSTRYKLNHEHRATHSLQVTASDGVHEVSAQVIVRVNDLDEPGRVSFWKPESVCLPVLHAILSDPDTDRSGFNLSWERSDNGVDGWALIGQIEATSSSYSALASDSGKFIRATVTYSDKFGAGKTAQRVQALGEFAPPRAGCESMAMGRVNRSIVTRRHRLTSFRLPADLAAIPVPQSQRGFSNCSQAGSTAGGSVLTDSSLRLC